MYNNVARSTIFMNNEWLKCPYCDFEQIDDSSKKEIICKKCGKTYTAGAGTNYYLKYKGYDRSASNNDAKIEGLHFSEEERKKLEEEWEESSIEKPSKITLQPKNETIGELNLENRKIRNKNRNKLFVYLLLQIILVIASVKLIDYDNTDTLISILGFVIFVLAVAILFSFFGSLKDKKASLIEKAAGKNPNMSIDAFCDIYSDELNEIERKKEEARIRHQEEMEYRNKVNNLEKEYHHYRSMARTFDKDTSKADWDNEQADIALAKIANLKKK